MLIQHTNEGGYLDVIEFEEVTINEIAQRFRTRASRKRVYRADNS